MHLEAVITTLLKFQKVSTNSMYHQTWQAFQRFASSGQFDPFSSSSLQLLVFLKERLDKGLSVSSLRFQLGSGPACPVFNAVLRISPLVCSFFSKWKLPEVFWGLFQDNFFSSGVVFFVASALAYEFSDGNRVRLQGSQGVYFRL